MLTLCFPNERSLCSEWGVGVVLGSLAHTQAQLLQITYSSLCRLL